MSGPATPTFTCEACGEDMTHMKQEAQMQCPRCGSKHDAPVRDNASLLQRVRHLEARVLELERTIERGYTKP